MDNVWDGFLQKAGEVVLSREHYQRTLGKMASDIAKQYSPSALKDFSAAIKETFGIGVSFMTLKNYRWVWEKTFDLDLPADLSYRSLQFIASSGRPAHWAKRIKDEGLSSAEVFRLLREEKGLNNPEPKMTICPECQHEFSP